MRVGAGIAWGPRVKPFLVFAFLLVACNSDPNEKATPNVDASVLGDGGRCTEEPTDGTPCAPEGFQCLIGKNVSGCDSDGALCRGGVWFVTSTPGCASDAGTD